jgi:hypothetical protein
MVESTLNILKESAEVDEKTITWSETDFKFSFQGG